ncbi:MAG: hypothetical protein A2W33_01385 [Chloroflexi bacterium RBG_16_52_11]|nr:MAG: hypothetical protein A2W33_01385 [Chloroflexi bacterium RBG_16_52_11]
MRIVFIGAVEFSRLMLEKLIAMDCSPNAVVTSPDCGFNADHADVSGLADHHGISCHVTGDINSQESINWISAQKPDVIFCFGWSRLLRRPLLDLAPIGVIGFHPAALPHNRGRHPLIWALALGLIETASTFFFMDEGADNGDILSQVKITIDPWDDAGSLYNKMVETAVRQLDEFVPALERGDYQRIPQDHSQANYWRRRGPRDGEIDWRMAAVSLHNLVRALARPYVGAHFIRNGRSHTVWRSRVVDSINPFYLEPGRVIKGGERPLVRCGDGCLELVEVAPAVELQEGEAL